MRVSEWLRLWINLWIDTWQVFWLILVSFVLMSSTCHQTDTLRRVWINNNSSGSHAIWPFRYAPFIAEWICPLVCILLCAGLVNTINAHNIHTCYQIFIHSCQISDENLLVKGNYRAVLARLRLTRTRDLHDSNSRTVPLSWQFLLLESGSGTSRPWKIKWSMFLPHVEYRLHSSAASSPRRMESSTSGSSRLQDCHVSWFSSVSLNKFRYSNLPFRSRWPRCLSCTSTAAWLLVSRVRIPLRVWMFVLFVLRIAASATSWSLVRTSPTGCVCLIVCDLETSTIV